MYIKEDPNNDLHPVTETELTRLLQQACTSLWAGSEPNLADAFVELSKLLFCKIYDERTCKQGKAYHFQLMSHTETPEQVFARVQALYASNKALYPQGAVATIGLSPAKVTAVVALLAGVNLVGSHPDPLGKAYEVLTSTQWRGQFGQYFTPRNIVEFIVNALPISAGARVLDPACGSGGLLLAAGHAQPEAELYGIELHQQVGEVARLNLSLLQYSSGAGTNKQAKNGKNL